MRKKRQVERTQRSDQRMIEVAIEIMRHHGISGLRLTEVGLRAGYSRGLAAMRFGTMGGLLRRVAEHLGREWLTLLAETLQDKTGLAAIHSAIDAQEQYLSPPALGVRVQYLILFHSIDPGAAERLNTSRLLASQRRDLATWLRQGIKAGEIKAGTDVNAEAASILGSMVSIVFQSLIDSALSPREMSARLKSEIAARLAPATPQRRGRTPSLPN